MNKNASTWIILVETLLLCLFAVLYFKTCNTPIVSDTRVEDSLRRVAKLKDSIYVVRRDSAENIIDSAIHKADYWESLYNGTKIKLDQKNRTAIALLNENNELKKSGNIDSLNKAIANTEAAYLNLLDLTNTITANCDSVLLSKDKAFQEARKLMVMADYEIQDLKSQRDAALADDHAKDSTINKMAKKSKANNLWAKIASVGLILASVIAIVK